MHVLPVMFLAAYFLHKMGSKVLYFHKNIIKFLIYKPFLIVLLAFRTLYGIPYNVLSTFVYLL